MLRIEYYILDFCHFFSSPGLSQNAMLKVEGVELEVISNVGIYQFIKKGTGGGVSYIAQIYSKPNNEPIKCNDKSRVSV